MLRTFSYYICRFGCWHLKGIQCECGKKPVYLSDRKVHG